MTSILTLGAIGMISTAFAAVLQGWLSRFMILVAFVSISGLAYAVAMGARLT